MTYKYIDPIFGNITGRDLWLFVNTTVTVQDIHYTITSVNAW